MNLVIFDIDGTIVNSVKADDECFIQTFKNLYRIDLSTSNWIDYKHVTDSGLTIEIFEKHFGQKPTKKDLEKIKAHFYNILLKNCEKFREVKGAKKFIENLLSRSDSKLAIATGGWKETAILKLESIGLNLRNIVLKSSNDHYDRAEIIKLAIKESLKKSNARNFESITYIGDGVWDYKTSTKLGLRFVGIDNNKNGDLTKVGAKIIFSDFEKMKKITDWILTTEK